MSSNEELKKKRVFLRDFYQMKENMKKEMEKTENLKKKRNEKNEIKDVKMKWKN